MAIWHIFKMALFKIAREWLRDNYNYIKTQHLAPCLNNSTPMWPEKELAEGRWGSAKQIFWCRCVTRLIISYNPFIMKGLSRVADLDWARPHWCIELLCNGHWGRRKKVLRHVVCGGGGGGWGTTGWIKNSGARIIKRTCVPPASFLRGGRITWAY